MHLGELAEIDLLRNVASRLDAAAYGEAGAIVADAAAMLGCSCDAVYRRLRKVGWASGRKLRSDRGDSRISEGEVREVAAMMMASQRATGKILLDAEETISIALSDGALSTEVAPTTLLRQMRRYGCHPAQLQRATPHVTMRSLHPNHVWQLDASVCVLYRMKNGRARLLDERTFNARKPRDLAKILNERVLRYAITDHYTGDCIARYYETSGEDQRTLFDFLMWALHAQPGRVMHGVPWMLVWDAGAANQSHGIVNLLTALGVRHWAHVPGNSRAKGQVERMHDIIERKFEGRLAFVAVDSIEQLNAYLDTWLKAFNGGRKHSRHGHTRDALWQTIRVDQLRICPPVETCAVLMHSKPELRKVDGNLTITFKARGFDQRHTYSVANVPSVRNGEQVAVVVNPYRMPAVFIVAKDADGSTRYFECEPLERDAAGFIVHGSAVFGESFVAHADSDVDHARKDANFAAYGERETKDALTAKAKGKVAFNGRIDPFKDVREKAERTPSYLQRRGTEIDLPNPMQLEDKPLSLIEALQELRARIGRPLATHESAAVRAWFPEGVPVDQVDALVERIEQLNHTGDTPPITAPRLVAVR